MWCRVDLLALALALIHALTRRLAELNRRRNTYRHIGDNGTCSWGKIEGRWSPATSDEKRIDHSGAKQRKRNRSRNRSVRACAERHVLRERQPVRRRHDAGTRRAPKMQDPESVRESHSFLSQQAPKLPNVMKGPLRVRSCALRGIEGDTCRAGPSSRTRMTWQSQMD